MRRDAECCSKRCRQARHRFTVGVGPAAPTPVAGVQPRRLAYADPPYPGLSARYYADHPDYGGEVDHAELVSRLSAEFDAWALSTSAEALPAVLSVCPPGVRVAAWVRGARPHASAGVPLNAWEPVIYAGAIRRPSTGDASRPPGEVLHDASRRDLRRVEAAGEHDASLEAGATRRLEARRLDVLEYAARPRLTDPNRVIGAKPAVFCRWVFDLLGATPADTFVDVFPGSGGVARAWETFTAVQRDASHAAAGDASRTAAAS